MIFDGAEHFCQLMLVVDHVSLPLCTTGRHGKTTGSAGPGPGASQSTAAVDAVPAMPGFASDLYFLYGILWVISRYYANG